jgi:hypothetical protein
VRRFQVLRDFFDAGNNPFVASINFLAHEKAGYFARNLEKNSSEPIDRRRRALAGARAREEYILYLYYTVFARVIAPAPPPTPFHSANRAAQRP